MRTEHVTIYREPGRYAGWPANYGMWSWNDEIVVGFAVGYHDDTGAFHTRDRSRPFTTMQARSLDGGATWDVAPTPCHVPGGRALSADEHTDPPLRIAHQLDVRQYMLDCPAQDVSNPEFALMCGRTGLHAGATSWFYTSTNRARSWEGPYPLPDFGLPGVAARTDYLVAGTSQCTLFLTAAKSNGREGRPFCVRTEDGGATFGFLAWIGPEPQGFGIMPASLKLPGGRVLAAIRVRCDEDGEKNSIDLHASDDDCQTWYHIATPVTDTGRHGNPPTLTRLHDERLCITYGFRDAPYQMRAAISSDDGLTWPDVRVLRDHGGGSDLGYPRSVQRPDGDVVTAYYFNDGQSSERHIAATIWTP